MRTKARFHFISEFGLEAESSSRSGQSALANYFFFKLEESEFEFEGIRKEGKRWLGIEGTITVRGRAGDTVTEEVDSEIGKNFFLERANI